MLTIDTTNICSQLQMKLFEEDGIYHHLWIAMQDDPELTAVVRSRQLHIYRNGKKVLVLAGKELPKSSERINYVRFYKRKKVMANALLYYLIVINILTFAVYGIDKWKARQGSWRISEATLLMLAVIGGTIGALLGMQVWPCRR